MAENDDRVFIISKRASFIWTVFAGAAPPEISAGLEQQAEQEVQEAVKETVLSVNKAASNALEESTRLQ